MDDFTYDCVVKKRIACGDRHRKRGSKSKRCTLGSDYMSEAQWRKKNGVCKSMNLDKPIDWKTFQEWPADISREYIQRMTDIFHCNMTELADFFGISTATLRRQLGKIQYPVHHFKKGHRMSPADTEALHHWMGEEPVPEVSAATALPVQHLPDNQAQALALMQTPHMEMDFIGVLNPQQITNTILAVAGSRRVRLRVIVDDC